MGEQKMELIEHTVKNNTEDIREIKKKMEGIEDEVQNMKTSQQLTQQNVTHILGTLSEFKTGFKELEDKISQDRDNQLKQYKTTAWKVAGAIITAIFLMQFGLGG